ncbi:MAG: Ig-like domain-containing protein [Thermoplasmata archaeon]
MKGGAVSWDEEGLPEAEEVLMVEEEPPDAPPGPSAGAQGGHAGAQRAPLPRSSIDLRKLAAVAVVAVVVIATMAVLLTGRPGTVVTPHPKPPPGVNDTLAAPDVLISEVMPEMAGSSVTPYVEIQVGEGVPDLSGWRLTTYDDGGYRISSTPGTRFRYVLLEFPPGTGLTLDAKDELGLYDSEGRLVDFVRWGGGGGDAVRATWPPASPGPYLRVGESASRIGLTRYDPAAWNSSPPSPREPNILEVEPGGVRQVIWLRSGRHFSPTLSLGSGSVSLPAGRPVSRALLMEAAAHIEYSLKQLRRLGEPFASGNTSRGAPLLEVWVTNGSSYGGVTEASGRVSLMLGPGRAINAYFCARQIACLIQLAKWGAPSEATAFIREGMATAEGLQTAALETYPSAPTVETILSDMRAARLYNPYDNGRDLSRSFIDSWSCSADDMASSWLFYEYLQKRFVESGLGASLSQTMLHSGKDPLAALTSQMGKSLQELFWDYLAWRTQPGFRYPQPVLQSSQDIGSGGAELLITLPPWTAWVARLNSTMPGTAEVNISSDPASIGPLHFIATATRTGVVLFRGTLQPGASSVFAAPGLRVWDELILVAASGERYGGAVCSASYLPPPPSGLQPPDGTWTNKPLPSFEWSPVEGASGYEVQISRDPSFLSLELSGHAQSPPYTPPAPLPDGRHYWRVRGLTAMGTPTEWSQAAELLVDTVPPLASLVLTEPKYRAAPEHIWNISSITRITFTHGSEPLAPETIYFRFSELEEWQRHTGEFALTGADGARSLQWRSEDAAGNVQPVQTLTLNLDNSPPDVELEIGSPKASATPDDITNVSDRTPISIRAADQLSGVGQVSFRIDNGAWTQYREPFSLSGLAEGYHIVSVQATDNLGNAASGSFRLYLDLTPPELSLEGLTEGVVPHGVRQVRASAADRSGVATVSYLVDGSPRYAASSAPFEWRWDTAAESDGTHTVEVRAVDVLGNVAYLFVSVLTDNTPPSTSLSIGSPKHRAQETDRWNVSSRTNLTLTASDDCSGLEASWFVVDGKYIEATELFLRELPDGPHTIIYGSQDRAGNNESGTEMVLVLDNTPPSPSFITPQQNDFVSGVVSISVSEGSGAGDVRNCTFYYSSDGVNWHLIAVDSDGSNGWGVSWSTHSLSNGSYWLRAEMRDMLDNVGVQTINVMVEN